MNWRGLSLIAACGLAPGCLVSFDGYRGLEAGGTGHGGDASTAGDASGGKTTAGKGGGGKSNAGTPNSGDAGEPAAGAENGGSGQSGNAGNPPGGSDNGGAAGSSGNGGSGGNPPQSCPINLEGPLMIEVPKTGGGFFCMDRTEVPSEDYAVFLATNPAAAGQIAACTWNASFQPDTSTSCATALGAYDPMVRPRVPVSCIDWCDAKRYCEWAGKRLCGSIAGGTNAPASFADPEASQWYRACSKAGTQRFPYGDTYQSQYCVGLDNSGTHPSDVTSEPACEGGYDGLYDLSGNVAEWEDSCSANAGAGDACLTRGGHIQSVQSTAPSLLCNDSALNDATPMPATTSRNTMDELIGFRCCLDL